MTARRLTYSLFALALCSPLAPYSASASPLATSELLDSTTETFDARTNLSATDVIGHSEWFLTELELAQIASTVDLAAIEASNAQIEACIDDPSGTECCQPTPNNAPGLAALERELAAAEAVVAQRMMALNTAQAARTAFLATETGRAVQVWLNADQRLAALRTAYEQASAALDRSPRDSLLRAAKTEAFRAFNAQKAEVDRLRIALSDAARREFNNFNDAITRAQRELATATATRDALRARIAALRAQPATPGMCEPETPQATPTPSMEMQLPVETPAMPGPSGVGSFVTYSTMTEYKEMGWW